MILEQYVIRSLLTKVGYDLYREYIDLHSLEVNQKKILILIDKLYNEDTKEIHIEDLKALLISSYPSMKEQVRNLIFDFLDAVYKIDDNSITYKEVMQNYKNKELASKLCLSAVTWVDNPETFDIDEIKSLIERYESTKVDEDDGSLREYSWDDLLNTENPDVGLTWPWKDVTNMVGRQKGGTVTLVIATPDTGKSAFCHTIATHFAESVKVLHINNEERDTKVALRARCCYCKIDSREAISNPESRKPWDKIAHNWMHRDKEALTIKDIETYIKRDKPRVVIIDQATKIKIKDAGRTDLTLTNIFKELRELAKIYNVDIIGVSQADKNAYTAKFIRLEHVANSNIGIQGEVDTLIGLVRENDSPYVNVSAPKAKESGNSHITTVLELNKKLSRMEEIN